MSTSPLLRFLMLLGLVALGLVAWACTESEDPLPAEVAGWPVTRGAAPGYVPDQACRGCHESLYDSYQQVGMARSFYRLTPATAVEDFGASYYQAATGYHYTMSERGSRYFLERHCRDESGEAFARHEVEVAWVVGSGNHARTYFAQSDHGELFQLPLTWYTGKGWGMSPGYELPRHDRFERQILRACMFCHNAYPEVPVGTDLPDSPHLFPREMPHGIGCQRCHGPGARHVQAATDEDADTKEIIASILNPKRFTPRQRHELCMTCHMQPDVSSGGDSTSRMFGRPVYSHRPDQSILDSVVYIDFGAEAERRSKIEVNHHGYRMQQSRCYSESDGALTCLSCHDPHRKVPEPERPAHYRRKCLQCHHLTDCKMEEMGASRDPSQSDCVSCHMFPARPRDVIEVVITDHLIRRKLPAKDLVAPRQPWMPREQPQTVPLFPERSPRGPLLDLHRGLALAGRLRPEQAAALEKALDAADPDAADAYLRVGQAMRKIGDHARAINVLRAGLGKFADHPGLRWNLAAALHRSGHHDEAMRHLGRALAIDRQPRALELLGNLHATANQPEQARAAFAEALQLRPGTALTWRRLARVLVQLGREDEAAAAFQNAIAHNPDEAEPYLRLARIHLRNNRHHEALRVLRHGASRQNRVRLELVVLLCSADVRLRNLDAAIAQATIAVQKAPQDGPPHLYLAFAEAMARRGQVARHIQRARDRGADPACCTGLAVLEARQRGDAATATALLARFRQELATPGAEPLRKTIARQLGVALPGDR